MRSMVYRQHGDADVLEEVELPMPVPQAGEVVVRMIRSAVNPTDWKARRGAKAGSSVHPMQTPHQDGAGVVEAVGQGVDARLVGHRVWVWEAARDRPRGGTAQQFSAVPVRQTGELPHAASWDLGSCLGIPFLTAHRALTINEGGPVELCPGALEGRTVFVAGGAGAVGNAAIQLAKWAGAMVLTSVSSTVKEALAINAGADVVVNYRSQDVVSTVLKVAPKGVDTIVEVAPHANAETDARIVAHHGAIAMYSDDHSFVRMPLRANLSTNARWQYVYVYTVPDAAKDLAVLSVNRALQDGAIAVGEDAGLPLHHFDFQEIRVAQDAVEQGIIGRVIVSLP